MDHDHEDQNYGAELTSVPCRVCTAPVYRTGKRGPVPRIHKGCHDLERAIALLGAAIDRCPDLPAERARIVRGDIWALCNRGPINPRNRRKG